MSGTNHRTWQQYHVGHLLLTVQLDSVATGQNLSRHQELAGVTRRLIALAGAGFFRGVLGLRLGGLRTSGLRRLEVADVLQQFLPLRHAQRLHRQGDRLVHGEGGGLVEFDALGPARHLSLGDRLALMKQRGRIKQRGFAGTDRVSS